MKISQGNLSEGAKARLEGIIEDIQFSPDGTRFAVASRIGIWIYNAHMGKELKLLTGHTGTVLSVAFSPDGRTIASGITDNTVWLWNTVSGKRKDTLIGKARVLTFSPDGQTLGGITDENILLWDLTSGERRHILTGASDIAFSPDSQTLASAEGFDGVRLWDVVSGKHKDTFTRDTGPIESVAFSPNGRTLASAASGEVLLWRLTSGECKHILRHSGSAFVDIAFSPDGYTLASVGVSDVKLWDVVSGKHKDTFKEDTGLVKSVAFSPDSQTLASAGINTVRLWNVSSGTCKYTLINRESQIQQICKERGITTLVHFTRVETLRSILHEGLLDHQSLLKKHGQQFVPNDRKRLDGHKEAICLSISFPNYQLFSKFSWSDNNNQPDYSGWVVLLLDAKVLWELDCAFCQENAVSNTVRYIPLEEKQKPDALKGMFVDVCRDTKGNVYQRRSLQIPDDYPTHPQAEVLVFDQIQSDYIKEVHFYDETTLKQWRDSNPWINPERLLHNQQYFQYGWDQITWQDDNLDDDDIPF